MMRIPVSGGDRIDKALLVELRTRYPEISRARLKSLFQEKKILWRGRAVAAAVELPAGAHEIEILGWNEDTEARLALAPKAKPAPEGCFLPVVYEDADLLVLHKFSGVPSVPHSAEETRTAVSAALAHFPGLESIGRGDLEPGLLHRLDTGTSGLLVFAKTEQEFQRLHAAWRMGLVRKIYRAVSESAEESAPAPLPLTLELDLAHDAKSAKKMIVIQPETRESAYRGKPLRTWTQIIQARPIFKRSSGSRLDFEVEIRTGVMHQIRCTLAHLGWPICGDPIYRGLPAGRPWLHASQLEFPLNSGQTLTLQARIPENWPVASDTSK